MTNHGESDLSQPSGHEPTTKSATESVEANATEEPRRAGHPWIAWFLIIGIATTIAMFRATPPEADDDVRPARADLFLLELQGKYLVGTADLPGMDRAAIIRQVEPLNRGSLAQRLSFVILTGELAGRAAALEHLDELDSQLAKTSPAPRSELLEVMETLRRLYTVADADDNVAPTLNDAQRARLEDELGWFGTLALASDSGDDQAAREAALAPARRTMQGVAVAGLAAMMAGMLGSAAFVAFVALAVRGKLIRRFGPTSVYGGVYAETFALWLILLFALGFLQHWISRSNTLSIATVLVMLGSLSALAWPVLRRVPPAQMFRDVGLVLGRRPLGEVLYGWIGYLATLPLLFVGVIAAFVAIYLQGLLGGSGGGDGFSPTEMPSHPVIGWLAEGGWWERLLVLLLACVAAPIVEETMFRGFLYRQLRDSTAAWRVGWSVVLSALLNSFVFAAIHPQGLLAIPPLMALAVGFSLIREWRGSLLAPMTAHATNNGIVTILLISIA